MDVAPTLGSLPDDAFQQVIEAFTDIGGSVPFFDAVKVLGCLSKGMRQQLHRLQPLVGVRSLAVVQRPAHGPWRVVLFYTGRLTAAVFEQARLGRVAYVKQLLLSLVAQTSASWRSRGVSQRQITLRLPQAPASLGQSAANQPLISRSGCSGRPSRACSRR